jgi:Domain of unknown function (DUF4194)
VNLPKDSLGPDLDRISATIQESATEPKPDGLLFLGDRGELPLETRRVLVQLLSGPSLEIGRHGKLWPVLLQHEDVIRRRLSELFLELMIDREVGVAFTRQADTGDLQAPLLLRRSQLTFIDSIVLLDLRQRLAQADAHGERAVVSGTELVDELGVFEPASGTDHAGFAKRIRASVEKFKERSILEKIRTTEDRYEISPTLKLLFSPERIEALTALYKQMAENLEAEPGLGGESDAESEP